MIFPSYEQWTNNMDDRKYYCSSYCIFANQQSDPTVPIS